MIFKKIHHLFPSILFSIYILSSLIFIIKGAVILIYVNTLLGLLAFFVYIFFQPNSFPSISNKNFLLFLVFLTLMYLVSMLINLNSNFRGFFANFQFFGMILLLTNFRIYKNQLKLIYFLFIIFLLYHFLNKTNTNEIFVSSSRNMISALLILLTCLIYFFEKNKLSIIFPIFMLIFSIWAEGRSGIISSAFIFFGLLLHKLDYLKYGRKYIVFIFSILLSVLIFFILILYFPKTFDSIVILFDRILTLGLNDVGRSSILSEYFKIISSDIIDFIFGPTINKYDLFSYFDFNLHNSFLNAHSRYGIIGFSLIIFFIIYRILKLILKRNFSLLFIFFGLLFRISTDYLALPGILDLIFYPILFDSFSKLSSFYKYKFRSHLHFNQLGINKT